MRNPYRLHLDKWIFLFSLIFVSLFVALISLTPKLSLAAVRCETQYGGTEVCVTTGELQVDKEVFDPRNNKFVDNLGINNHKFSPGEEVRFKIKVKNAGDAAFSNVTVADTPQSGFFELAGGSLNFNLADLKPGETREQEIKLKVLNSASLPQNNVVCVINSAEAKADGESDRDSAQLCLERKVLGAVTELPKTGPESFFLALFGSAAGILAGARFVGVGRNRRKEVQSDYQMVQSMIIKKGRGC